MTLEQPAGEMWQKIREELNENPDTREQDLAHIKEWLKKEPHLPDEFGKRFTNNFNNNFRPSAQYRLPAKARFFSLMETGIDYIHHDPHYIALSP